MQINESNRTIGLVIFKKRLVTGMRNSRLRLTIFSLLLLGVWLLAGNTGAAAQQTINELFITGSDTSAAPSVDLYVYAIDGRGNKVDLAGQSFVVSQDGVPISNWELAGPHAGGVLTVFVIDIPEGVSSFIPVIQDSISRYASDSYMMEGTDYVGVYRVGELGATEMLAPDAFHNSVLNVFASPPPPSSGSTALVDSLMNILNNIEALKPEKSIPTHIVIISDGTDVVSTQNEPEDLPRRAAELGVPIHTIWLDNQSLSADKKRVGQQYLTQLAAGTRGETTNLATADQLTTLWDKISSFRNHTILRYTADEMTSGDHTVGVSLAGNPSISAQSTVSLAPGAPLISLDIPEDSRQMTLASLDQPVQLSFSTTTTWPDEGERTLASAFLQVNGILAQDLDVSQLDSFDVSINSLAYGDNRFQIVAIDDQGHRVATPEVVMTILEGETVIPDAVSPSSAVDRILDRFLGYGKYIGGCFLILIVIVVLIVMIRFLGRSSMPRSFRVPSIFRRIPFLRNYVRHVDKLERSSYRVANAKRQVSRYTPDVHGLDQRGKGKARPTAFLEVLQATGQTPGRIDLDIVEMRLGRSSKQADFAFSDDATVSRIHATVVQEGGDHRIFDEQSTSGTFVNEQRVPQHGLQLVDGDEIRLGAVRLRYRQP
jgi:hypothetical protein